MLQGMVGPLNEEQQKQLEIVKNSARHLLALINDVIDLSKIEAGKVEIITEEFDASRAISEVYDSFKATADKKNVSLTLEIPDKLIINSDKRRVQQVVLNLVSNAIKFSDKGSVRVSARTVDNEQHSTDNYSRATERKFVEISVEDTGIGIKEEDRDKLFIAFSRIHLEGAPKQEGTGLGLYLSKKIAHLIGGGIEVESEFGKGSIFRLLLPIRK
jgi:signal transduction histidine kinase